MVTQKTRMVVAGYRNMNVNSRQMIDQTQHNKKNAEGRKTDGVEVKTKEKGSRGEEEEKRKMECKEREGEKEERKKEGRKKKKDKEGM